jgi:DNA polymerase-3 subunit delta'
MLNIIGQEYVQRNIDSFISNNTLPRTLIISGELGSGRKTMCRKISLDANLALIIFGTSIQEVRECINLAYTITTPTLFIFDEIQEMTAAAENALLKVIEEPPNNVYFALIVKNKSFARILPTIQSRSTTITMRPYTKDELKFFTTDPDILRVCDTPGLIKMVDKEKVIKARKCAEDLCKAVQDGSGVAIIKILREFELSGIDDTDIMLVTRWMSEEYLMDFDILSEATLKEYIHGCAYLGAKSNSLQMLQVMMFSILRARKNED